MEIDKRKEYVIWIPSKDKLKQLYPFDDGVSNPDYIDKLHDTGKENGSSNLIKLFWISSVFRQQQYAGVRNCLYDNIIVKELDCDNTKINNNNNNIYVIPPLLAPTVMQPNLGDMVDHFQLLREDLTWCDDNGVLVLLDNCDEATSHIFVYQREIEYPSNAINSLHEMGLMPNQFKICANTNKKRFGINCFDMEDSVVDMAHFLHGDFPIINETKKEFLFSIFAGEISKRQRLFAIGSLMAEGLLEENFYSTLCYHSYTSDEDLPHLFDECFHNLIPHNLNNYEFIKDNVRGISSNKLFDKDITYNQFEILSDNPSFNSWNHLKIPDEMYGSHFNIPFETHGPDEEIFFTEKTYKPIISEIPFLIFGSKNQNKHLEKHPYGFEIFREIFDYSFEETDDIIEYVNGFVEEIKRINAEPRSIFTQPSVIEKVKYNKELFLKKCSNEYRLNKLDELFTYEE